jgi:hypothetical protein
MAGAALVWLSCSAPTPRTVTPTRALDEARAVELIARAFADHRAQPVRGGKLDLGSGKVLQIDVGASGRRFGVAYVTPQERIDLGSALPPRDPAMGDALQLVSGLGEDAQARVLLLYDSDYSYDDAAGEHRESSAVIAERKLERDVSDFLVRAQAEQWP